MSSPNDPLLCCPLPYRVAPVFVQVVSPQLGWSPLMYFLVIWSPSGDIVVVIITMLYVNEMRYRCYQVFSPSSASSMYSTAILVCSLEQSNPLSHPQTIVQGSMAQEHEHRADQVPIRVGGKQCRLQRFIGGTSLPSMYGLVNVRWRCLVIMFPNTTMHVSSQYIRLKIFSHWGRYLCRILPV